MENGEWIPRPEEPADWTALFARLLGESAACPSVGEAHSFDELVGRSIGFRTAVDKALAAASTEEPVLLTGESGSGKASFARAIHEESGRSADRFIEIDCRVVPAGALERLLNWGSGNGEESSFAPAGSPEPLRAARDTDSVRCAPEDATIYLQDISALDRALQGRLARWMDARRLADVSGTERSLSKEQHAASRKGRGVRIVAGTRCDLALASRTGAFDRNLYRRLSEHEIQIPPLRERPADVLLLATHFLERLGSRSGEGPIQLTTEARQRLAAHSWPGNVRELIGVLQIAVLKSNGARSIDETHLAHGLRAPRASGSQASTAPSGTAAEAGRPDTAEEMGVRFHGHELRIDLPEEGASFDEIEKAILQAALTRARGNVVRAARLLKLGRGSLRYRLEKHSINQPRRRRRSRRRAEEASAGQALPRAS